MPKPQMSISTICTGSRCAARRFFRPRPDRLAGPARRNRARRRLGARGTHAAPRCTLSAQARAHSHNPPGRKPGAGRTGYRRKTRKSPQCGSRVMTNKRTEQRPWAERYTHSSAPAKGSRTMAARPRSMNWLNSASDKGESRTTLSASYLLAGAQLWQLVDLRKSRLRLPYRARNIQRARELLRSGQAGDVRIQSAAAPQQSRAGDRQRV